MSELEAIAVFSYTSEAEDEVSLIKGEVVVVVEAYDDGWWLVSKTNGSEGLVPANYLKATRVDAENSLLFQNLQAANGVINESFSNTPVEEQKTHSLSSVDSGVGSAVKYGANAEELSAIILAKISDELSVRETKIMEEVRRMIGQSTAPFLDLESKLTAAEMEQNRFKSQTHELPSQSDQVNDLNNGPSKSKIPTRVSLPKIITPHSQVSAPPSNLQKDSKDEYKKRRASLVDSKLPVLASRPKQSKDVLIDEDSSSDAANVQARSVSADGIRYPHCRSKVYAPSCSRRNPEPRPAAELRLEHIYGYDGDFNRHGSAIRGKNVCWLNGTTLLYPAAAIVIIQDIIDRKQSFFCAHSEDVTCVSVSSSNEGTVVASGQLGKDCAILLWDASLIEKGTSSGKYFARLTPLIGVRGISGVDFSGDGKFLLAAGIDESHSIMIFNWKEGTMVAHAKVGHVDVYEVVFNPYLFAPVPPFNEAALAAAANGKSPQKGNRDPAGFAPTDFGSGCYTIISYGKKNIKFWTLREFYVEDPNSLEEISSFRGRKLSVKKGAKDFTLKYVLEGTLGSNATKGQAMPALTSYFITDETSHAVEGTSSSKVFMGTNEGSIYVWQHVEDTRQMKNNERMTGWLPRGRLLSVITELHDTAIVCMDYLADEDKVLSCSSDGVVNVWNFSREDMNVAIPLQHVGSFELDNEYARSASWNKHGSYAALGTACNSVLLVMCGNNHPTQDSVAVGSEHEEVENSFSIEVLTQSHDGKVRRIAVNPILQSILASVSSDKTVRFWDTHNHRQLCYFQLTESATAIAFSSDGKLVATGDERGELSVFSSEELDSVIENKILSPDPLIQDHDPLFRATWKQIVRRNICTKSESNSGNSKRKATKKCEITEIKYSPSGQHLAIGSRDKLIHILSTAGYKHIAVCRGHSSYIRNIDYSENGALIQSTDTARELLHWDAHTGQRVTNASAFRDLRWNSVSCIYGWGVMGVFNGTEDVSPVEGEVNCVCGSPDGKWLVAGGSHTVHHAVKLFNYPCLNDAIPSFHGGHTSPVLDVSFIVGVDGSLAVATAGGNDSCLFQWKLTSIT